MVAARERELERGKGVTRRMTTIQCQCGDVKVELSGDPVAQFYCHCRDCQRVHGAGYIPVSMYRADQVKVVDGDPSLWKLRVTPRATCRACGTRVFAEPPIGMRGVNALLLPDGAFKAQFHVQCSEAHLPIRDDLPHFKGYPASFGGADDTVDW